MQCSYSEKTTPQSSFVIFKPWCPERKYTIAWMKDNSQFPPACICFQRPEAEILKVGLKCNMRSPSSYFSITKNSLFNFSHRDYKPHLNTTMVQMATDSLDKICFVKFVYQRVQHIVYSRRKMQSGKGVQCITWRRQQPQSTFVIFKPWCRTILHKVSNHIHRILQFQH